MSFSSIFNCIELKQINILSSTAVIQLRGVYMLSNTATVAYRPIVLLVYFYCMNCEIGINQSINTSPNRISGIHRVVKKVSLVTQVRHFCIANACLCNCSSLCYEVTECQKCFIVSLYGKGILLLTHSIEEHTQVYTVSRSTV